MELEKKQPENGTKSTQISLHLSRNPSSADGQQQLAKEYGKFGRSEATKLLAFI